MQQIRWDLGTRPGQVTVCYRSAQPRGADGHLICGRPPPTAARHTLLDGNLRTRGALIQSQFSIIDEEVKCLHKQEDTNRKWEDGIPPISCDCRFCRRRLASLNICPDDDDDLGGGVRACSVPKRLLNFTGQFVLVQAAAPTSQEENVT